MERGKSRIVDMILKWLSDDTKLALDCFWAECCGREYVKFDNLDDAAAVLGLLDASFANKETLRRYPEEFTDGVFMVNASDYSKEGEYLINAGNLAYVSDVEMDGDSGAIVRAVLVPKNVYDQHYQSSVVAGV